MRGRQLRPCVLVLGLVACRQEPRPAATADGRPGEDAAARATTSAAISAPERGVPLEGTCMTPQGTLPGEPPPRKSGVFMSGVKPLATIMQGGGDSFRKDVSLFASSLRLENDRTSVAELWSLIGKVDAELASAREPHPDDDRDPSGRPDVARMSRTIHLESNHAQIAKELLHRGQEKDFDRLLDVFDASAVDAGVRHFLIESLIDYRIDQEIAAILRDGGIRVAPSKGRVELPKRLAAAPVELQRAWLCYRSVTTPTDKGAGRGVRSVQGAWADFYTAVSDVLRRKPGDHVAALESFVWGGECGTGSERLREPQHQAVFLAHLMARRFEPIIPMLIARANGPRWKRVLRGREDRILRTLGLDPLQMYLGSALENGVGLSALADDASDRAARYAVEMDAVSLGDDEWKRGGYVASLAAFVDPGPRGWNHSREYGRRYRVARDLQRKALEIIARSVDPAVSARIAEGAARQLSELKRPEAIPALQRAAALPYERTRHEAAQALKAMGVRVKIPPPAKAVEVLVRVNGRPLGEGAKVDWEAKKGESRGTMSSATIGGDGMVRVVSSSPK